MGVPSFIFHCKDFFSRKQLEGELIQEFFSCIVLFMEKAETSSPTRVPNSDSLLPDHFVEHANNSDLRRELKRSDSDLTLHDVSAEAIRWEREREPQASQTSSLQPQFDCLPVSPTSSQLAALTALIQNQQEQPNQITQTLL